MKLQKEVFLCTRIRKKNTWIRTGLNDDLTASILHQNTCCYFYKIRILCKTFSGLKHVLSNLDLDKDPDQQECFKKSQMDLGFGPKNSD